MVRLDPRIKILLAVLFTVVIFIVNSLILSALLALCFIGICYFAGIPLKKIFPHIKLLLFVILFVLLMQLLFGPENSGYLLKPLIPDSVPLLGGIGSLKRGGLFTGLMIGCRIIAISVLMPALVISTDTRLLAWGITRLGINYKGAFTITSAMNMISVFEYQAQTIIDARKLRGVNTLNTGNFLSRIKEYAALVNPLIIKAMKQSFNMGLAMDAKAFGAHKTRIWMMESKISATDIIALAAGILFSVLVTAADFIFVR